MRTITFDDLVAMGPCWSAAALRSYWGGRATATMWDVATHDGIHVKDKIWVLVRMITPDERQALCGTPCVHAAQNDLSMAALDAWEKDGSRYGELVFYLEEQFCRLLLSLGEVPK